MPLAHIGGEAAAGAGDVVFIHRIGPDAGMLGTAVGATGAGLSLGHHFADGLAAQTASTKGQRAEEAVVQLLPATRAGEFRDYLLS